MKKNVFLTAVCILLASCSQTDLQIENLETVSHRVSKHVYEVSDTQVSFDLAEKVARSTRVGTRSDATVNDIKVLCTDSGEPYLYAANFSGSGGFVLVSASQNYTPVLAEVESGTFDPLNMPENVRYYIEGYRLAIQACNAASKDSVECYRRLWKKYVVEESLEQNLSTRSNSPELDAFIFDSQRNWNNNGYQWTSLAENRLGLYFFDSVVMDYTDSNPDADLSTVFIVALPTVNSVFIDELLTTMWGQDTPYNDLIQNGCPAGCVPVAMAQIMKYHKKPAGYMWNAMSDYYFTTQSAPEVAELLKEIGTKAKTEYSLDGSSTALSNAKKVLVDYGYSSSSIVDHSMFTVQANLFTRKPVIGSGIDLNSKVGHAWVYDGIDFVDETYYYYLLVPRKDPASSSYFKFKWEQTQLSGEIAYVNTPKRLFHINWGARGSYEGWYSDHDIEFVDSKGKIHNYCVEKTDIVNIY